ncbi:hypothetical protein [Bacillus pinisoli]|uniref:hypothetical protein n=1 Tax=Bacillus pinisoli TaxID=2901866 RepID=UPI001FF638E6|nr:hypothetical protein [Bacillus pinisoli]
MKMLTLMTITITSMISAPILGSAQPEKCPVLSELEATSIKDREEIIRALTTLIPKTYGTGLEGFPDLYTRWNIVTAKPFPKTVGNEDEAYFGMAKTFCGKEIAEKSWLVRLDFPKAPGANLAQGQIFLAKSKEKGWFVWFRYH